MHHERCKEEHNFNTHNNRRHLNDNPSTSSPTVYPPPHPQPHRLLHHARHPNPHVLTPRAPPHYPLPSLPSRPLQHRSCLNRPPPRCQRAPSLAFFCPQFPKSEARLPRLLRLAFCTPTSHANPSAIHCATPSSARITSAAQRHAFPRSVRQHRKRGVCDCRKRGWRGGTTEIGDGAEAVLRGSLFMPCDGRESDCARGGGGVRALRAGEWAQLRSRGMGPGQRASSGGIRRGCGEIELGVSGGCCTRCGGVHASSGVGLRKWGGENL